MSDIAQQREFPATIPEGERLIWRGRPGLAGFALRAFHIREVAIYFGLLILWRLWSNVSGGMPTSDAIISAGWLAVPAACSIGVLMMLAWLFQRSTCYTITDRRVLLQFGVALPMTLNIPLDKISGAALKSFSDGSGDIPLHLNDSRKVSFVLLWPHIRPWRLREAEPMLRAVPEAKEVADKLAQALAGQSGPMAKAMRVHGEKADASASAIAAAQAAA